MGFTKYEAPKRILKIWQNNKRIEKKKTISSKLASLTHCSTKRAMQDFPLMKLILKRQIIRNQLKLSDEEIDYLDA